MDLGLKGKRVAVTGGSKGIGRAVAEGFAAEGAGVSICARNAQEVAATVAALKAKGVQAYGGAIDVADPEALKGWIARAPPSSAASMRWSATSARWPSATRPRAGTSRSAPT